MVLTVHHLSVSQSERVVWLLEELAVPYELHVYKRNAANHLAPPTLKSQPGNISGTAPLLHDSATNVTLNESGAIVEYLLTFYGEGKLQPSRSDAPAYARYLEWFHRANGSAQPAAMAALYLSYADVPEDKPIRVRLAERFQDQLKYAEAGLAKEQWIAGREFTAADVMLHFVFSGSRWFAPFSLKEYPNIRRWTADCAKRPAFQAAYRKGDPELLPYVPLGEESPRDEDKPWRK